MSTTPRPTPSDPSATESPVPTTDAACEPTTGPAGRRRRVGRGRRALVLAAIAGSVGVAGAAAAGHVPWSSSEPTPTGRADREIETPAQQGGAVAEPSERDRTAPPPAPVPAPVADAGADPSAASVTEATSPATDPAPSTDPTTTAPPETTAAVPVASTEPEVASAAGAAEGGPATTAPATTAAPAPATTAAPVPETPADPPAPAGGDTAPSGPPASTPPSSVPPGSAPTRTDTEVPQTMTLSCAQDGSTVTCAFSGSPSPDVRRWLLLRGQQGGAGRVVLRTTSSSATAVDAGLAPGSYLYTAIALDANDRNLAHSNQIAITIAG